MPFDFQLIYGFSIIAFFPYQCDLWDLSSHLSKKPQHICPLPDSYNDRQHDTELINHDSTFFGWNSIDGLMMINMLLVTTGLAIVIIFDRNIPLPVHIATIYFFLVSMICLTGGVVSLFNDDISVTLFFILLDLGALYLFFPRLLARTFKTAHLPVISWHFSNCILACSWAIFGYIFWSLFW